MTPWQKRARIGVAVIGIASAVAVYAAIGHRRETAAPSVLPRLDPKAILETTTGLLQQVRGEKQDFSVASDRQLVYENGVTKLQGVRISVKNRSGRDFVVSAAEAISGEHDRHLQLSGDIKLVASDGFHLTTDRASFSQDDGTVHADGAIAFGKGGMTGGGMGMTYDKTHDVLTIAQDAHITVADDSGHTSHDFQAGQASLDRTTDLLTLDDGVHVMRGEQVIETSHALAHLSPNDDIVTAMELRGDSRVEGGSSSVSFMSARDIDLTYSSDGQALQRIVMAGDSAIGLTSQASGAGRQVMADALTFDLAPDGSIQRGTGQQKVSMIMPASDKLPARRIQSDQFQSTGEAGKGLTAATFSSNVIYREELPGTKNGARIARAHDLQVRLDGDAIADAVFRGSVAFEEQTLKAAAGEAHYAPGAGTLSLARGADAANPTVADDRIAIEAQSVDVTLDTHAMSAKGTVKTTLAAGADSPDEGSGRLPGLLKQDQPAHVNANALTYDGAGGQALYTGAASLWQGETAIRADSISMDRSTGDLVATGGARAVLALDTGTSISRADRIRYSDTQHLLAYTMNGAAAMAQMSGPQGNLTANRIEAFLAPGGGSLDRLEAYTGVLLKIDTRTATGTRLTYRTKTEQYDLSGTATAPVEVVDTCRETTGKTLTFFKSTDRIIVDGNREIRTQTKSGAACAPSQPR
ncbi:MAG TPA: LptA/OstA family protein [Vicinamibacterales bacterium]|nr:LptA/OstA family protein [Vicinamibacterales bacterium]